MKIRVLMLIACVMLLSPLNLASSLPELEPCEYHDPRISLLPTKNEFAPGEPIRIIVDTLHDKTLEIVTQNPQSLEVFADIITSDQSGKATISIPTNDNSIKGTWKIFARAQSDESQEVVFVGVGQRAEPIIALNPYISNYAYEKDNYASFFVAGTPEQSLSVGVFDSNEKNMFKDRIILIPSEGRCNYVLNISGFGVGIYTVEISDKQEKTSTVFTVGIQPSTAPELELENSNSDLKYFKGTFSLYEKQVRYNIPYVISNGSVDDMTLSCEHGSLRIDVSSQSESDVNLDIELSRDILDTKTNGKDSRFVVLRDGEQIDYDEVPYSDHRRLSMSFPPDTSEIEIVSSVIPEFKSPTCKVADSPPYSLILPPLKQFKSGVPTNEIHCKDGLTMLLTPKDSRPVCVTMETAEKLIPRNWGIIVSRG